MSLEEDFKLELQDKLIELKNETQVIKDLLEENSILYDMNNVDNLIMFKNKFKTQFDKIRKSMREVENNMESRLDENYIASSELRDLENMITDAIFDINQANGWINSSIGC